MELEKMDQKIYTNHHQWMYSSSSLIIIIFGGIAIIVLFIIIRIVTLKKIGVQTIDKSKKSAKLLIVLGSGGHTTEMFRMLQSLERTKFSPRVYFIANSDKFSSSKLLEYEKESPTSSEFRIRYIPRARQVRQSWFTSVFTTAYALMYSIIIFVLEMPDVIICNGPGTCIPVCFIALLMRIFYIKTIPIVYIESFARVNNLSLSGKILYRFSDRFLVQWPELKAKYPDAEYLGTHLM